MVLHPEQMLPAGIAITVVVTAFNFWGDFYAMCSTPIIVNQSGINMNNLLTLNQVSIYDPHSEKKRVDNLSFSLKQGRTLAIVGESGSGKSLISKAIIGLLPSTLALSGEIF